MSLRHAAIKVCYDFDGGFGGGAVGSFVGIVVAFHFAVRAAVLDDNAVAAAEDDHVVVDKTVVDFGLRDEPGDLAADGDDGFVFPECASAVAGGVDDDLLREAGEVRGLEEFGVLDFAAFDEEVVNQLA